MKITDTEQIATYYQALLDRNSAYTGIFYAGVKTTGVFCIATCRAKKPNYNNVDFYQDIKSALNAGFRPCKICNPTQNAYPTPPEIEQALKLIQKNPKQRISDWQLKQQNIQPEKVRRWFNRHYGITYQTYQRMLRINTALQELKQGKTATHVAFDNGYDSLSGFNYTYKKITGKTPMEQTNIIVMQRITTPIGPMFIAATEKGICLLEFVDRRMLETELKDLQRLLKAHIIMGENDHTKQTQQQLKEYFNGQRLQFSVPLDTPGTTFQKAVWQQLQTIPCGQTRSYQQQAYAINNPNAVRAVARANGANRVSIIIPCHRVIGKNGQLTGYGGGLARKEYLLNHEKNIAP